MYQSFQLQCCKSASSWCRSRSRSDFLFWSGSHPSFTHFGKA